MALDSGGRKDETRGLTAALIRELVSAKKLIASLDPVDYSTSGSGSGSIGAHIRHDLNFIESVLNGVTDGVVDYAKRERDPRIETDLNFAASRIDTVIERIKKLNTHRHTTLCVVSEIDATMLHRSTLSRELEFVLSHTIHHHAIIKQKLTDAGANPDVAFGVAPSTLEYWQRRQE